MRRDISKVAYPKIYDNDDNSQAIKWYGVSLSFLSKKKKKNDKGASYTLILNKLKERLVIFYDFF